MNINIYILIIISSVTIFKLYSNEAEQQQLQIRIQQTQVQLQLLQAQHSTQQPDTALNQELQNTQGYYQNLSHTLAILADSKSDQAKGFSGYLTALASESDSNVWLTNIHFNFVANTVSLQGSSFKPEQIPLLLQRLQNTSVFKGRHLAKLAIQQEKDNQEQINFNVSSSLLPESEVENAAKP